MAQADGREAWRFETISVHGGYSPEPTTKAVAVPIYQTVAYAFDNAQHGADLFDLKVPGNIYTRIMNPDPGRARAARRGARGRHWPRWRWHPGQAAVTYSILTIAEAGDNIVASSALYGGTYNLFAHTLPQFGIDGALCRLPQARILRAADRRARPRRCSSSRSATRRATSPTSRASPRSPTGTACR